jgi:hypothetical protein
VTWVNEDVVVGLADSLSEFSTAKISRSNATVEGEQCYKFVLDNQQDTTHYSVVSNINFIAGKQYNLSFKYYIPAGQTVYRLNLNYGGYGNIAMAQGTGEWKQFNLNFTSTQSRQLRIYASDYNISVDGNASGEFFALQDVTLTQTAADGTVSKWYDQSTTSGVPNANHAVQTSAAKQPKIVSGGSLVTGGLDFDGVDDNLQYNYAITNPTSGSIFSVFNNTGTSNSGVVFGIRSTARDLIQLRSQSESEALIQVRDSGNVLINPAASSPSRLNAQLSSAIFNKATPIYDININGGQFSASSSTVLTGSITASKATIAATDIGTSVDGHFTGTIQEIIYYNSDQSANRPAIEANINNQYDIY